MHIETHVFLLMASLRDFKTLPVNSLPILENLLLTIMSWYIGVAIAARIPMIDSVTINSTNVKPAFVNAYLQFLFKGGGL